MSIVVTTKQYYVDIMVVKNGGWKEYEFMFPFFPIDCDIEYVRNRVSSKGTEIKSVNIRIKTTTWSGG